MGKDISGVGIDTNIIGRIGVRGQTDPGVTAHQGDRGVGPHRAVARKCRRVGLADVVTQRLYDKIDRRETYRNAITSGFMERGKIPLVADSDREAFEIALASCGHMPDRQERVIRVLDTLHLEEMYVSQAIAEELRNSPRIEIAGAGADLFDDSGTLATFSRDL